MGFIASLDYVISTAPMWIYVVLAFVVGGRVLNKHHERKIERRKVELEQENKRLLNELRYGKFSTESAQSPQSAIVRDGNVSTMSGQQVEKTVSNEEENTNLAELFLKAVVITGGVAISALVAFYVVGLIIW
ncbi:MAG: hypothetical protein ACQEQD_06685 [Bacillota bacterium]